MKNLLVTCGFPRTGNTYLNYSLSLLYFPYEFPNPVKHTVKTIESAKKIIVPFRHPIDCIASWHKLASKEVLEKDVKYYIRFYTFVLDNLSKIVLMDFNYFTKDIEYIKDKVYINFNIEPVKQTTDDEVQKVMLAHYRNINLPRDNKEELNVIKALLPNTVDFNKCALLYDELRQKSSLLQVL